MDEIRGRFSYRGVCRVRFDNPWLYFGSALNNTFWQLAQTCNKLATNLQKRVAFPFIQVYTCIIRGKENGYGIHQKNHI